MSRAASAGAPVLYLVVLALFGLGLVLAALWVFCTLSGPDFGTCVVEAFGGF